MTHSFPVMPKRKEGLAEEEKALKARYALLRRRRKGEEERAKRGQTNRAKVEAVKRAMKAKGIVLGEDAPKEAGFKRPSALQTWGDEGGDGENTGIPTTTLTPDEPRQVASKRQRPPVFASAGLLETPPETTALSSAPATQETSPTGPSHPAPVSAAAVYSDRSDLPYSDMARGPGGEVVYMPTTIFIGDLPEGTMQEELHAMFRRFGEIEELRVTGKGFAFIQFSTKPAADNAIAAMQNVGLRGKKIRVARARQGRGRVPPETSGNGGGGGGGGGGGEEASTDRSQPAVTLPPPRPLSDYEELLQTRPVLSYDDL